MANYRKVTLIIVITFLAFHLERFEYVTGAEINKNAIQRQFANSAEANPSIEEIPNWTKEQLENLDIDTATQKITDFCSNSLENANFNPELKRIELKLIASESSEVLLPLKLPQRLFRSPHFHLIGNVTIFFTGWRSGATNISGQLFDPVDRLYEAYKCRGTHNFLVIDTAADVDTFIEWATYDYRNVAKELNEDLVNLFKRIGASKIHLIGHGIGAHVAGFIGRHFYRATGTLLPRITGLDPANICIQDDIANFGLQKGDAKFIDVIHSSPYALGSSCQNGDVDFYLYGFPPPMPGCSNVMCAHYRAVDYFSRTVETKPQINLTGCKSITVDDALHNKCLGQRVPFGIDTPTHAKGNYVVIDSADAVRPQELAKCPEVLN